MIRTLSLGISRRAHYCSIYGIDRTVARDNCCAGLLLNIANIFLRCIISMLFSDFKARGLKSILTFPMSALTKFFHADTDTNVHLLLGSWYFSSSSLW